MAEFDLRAAVVEVLDGTGLADLGEVAAKVAENVPSRHLRSALAEALRSYVAVVNQQRRARNPIIGGGAVSSRSSKVSGIRDAVALALRDRVHVEGGMKLLGECTYDDLMFAAAERRENARRNLAKADQYEALAEKVRAHKAARVADLPPSVLHGLEAVA